MGNVERQAWRILDANANRAAEGLRSLEDHARLVCEDELAADWVKSLRDDLTRVLQRLDRTSRLTARSTQRDAGTELTGAREASRSSMDDVLVAASERVTQALRQLEETSKFLSVEVAEQFKQLRYKAYDRLAELELRLINPARGMNSGFLYLLIDCSRPIEQFVTYVTELAAAGVDWFQLRDKHADGGRLMEYGRAAKQALYSSDSRLIINDRLDIAMACQADGVHLGQDDMLLADARGLVGNTMLVGISTHSVDQAMAAEQGGADYIGCGPTFPSQTKEFSEFVGPELIRHVVESVQLPVFAIGGIEDSNVEAVMAAGCHRVAVSGAIHQAASPPQAARELKEKLMQQT
jgi:thiamine-phosphate pyrophosphorylase